MGLRSRPESCTDTSSQVPISGVVILSWRNLQSVREHTTSVFTNALKIPELLNFTSWADIFISALEGARAIRNFDLKELKLQECLISKAHSNSKMNEMGRQPKQTSNMAVSLPSKKNEASASAAQPFSTDHISQHIPSLKQSIH